MMLEFTMVSAVVLSMNYEINVKSVLFVDLFYKFVYFKRNSTQRSKATPHYLLTLLMSDCSPSLTTLFQRTEEIKSTRCSWRCACITIWSL
jgi:hypothetical protein